MGIYVGANNAKKEVAQLYLGRDGTKIMVTEAYALQDDNVKQVYRFIPEPGQQVFTSSGTFKAPSGVKSVDVFLVGGGGSGGFGAKINSNGQHYYIGSGGGGGYTKTVKGASVTAGTSYSIVVGSGGSISTGNNYTGGTSSALGYSIEGGTSGKWETSDVGSGNGGSGGGVGGMCESNKWSSASWQYGGNGGSNGSNGYYSVNTGGNILCTNVNWGSKGQGTTTRAFGESSGTLYAGGGASGRSGGSTILPYKGGSGGGGNGYAGTWDGQGTAATSGTANTGGGGGGGYREYTGAYDRGPRNGGSGVVIIRWGY